MAIWAHGVDDDEEANRFNPGRTTEGASANYGGSQGAYGAEANRMGTNIGASWDQNAGSRGSQMDALGMMRQAALGQTPSVAQMQMQQGADAAARQQMAMAASARGPAGLAMAQYNAAANTGAMQQQNNAQTAMLRAQEIANAQNAYMQGSSGMRGQDMQQAMGQEGLLQNMHGQQLQAQGNAAQQEMERWKHQSGLDERSARAQEEMGMKVAGGLSQFLGALSDKTMKTSIVAEDGGSGYNPYGGANAPGQGRYTEAMNPTLGSGMPTMMVTMPTSSRSRHDANTAPALVQADAPQTSIAVDPAVKEVVAARNAEPSKLGQAFTALGNSLAPSLELGERPRSAQVQPYAHIGQGPFMHNVNVPVAPNPNKDGLQPEMAVVQPSDERIKQGVQFAAPAQLMDNLKPYSYEYKEGTGLGGGRHYGIMAQDLESTPMGASAVRETPRGKAIDVAESTGIHFANEANLHQRLRALEDKLGKK